MVVVEFRGYSYGGKEWEYTGRVMTAVMVKVGVMVIVVVMAVDLGL